MAKSYSFTKSKQALDTKDHTSSLAHFKDLEKASEKDILYKVALKKIEQLEKKLHNERMINEEGGGYFDD